MNKKYWMKRQKNLRSQLKQLQARAENPKINEEELTEIEEQVTDITEQIDEVTAVIEQLPDEDAAQLEDDIDDLGAAADDLEDEEDASVGGAEDTDHEEEPPVDNTQSRSRVLGIIGRGLASKGEEKVKKLNKRSAFLRFLGGRISQGKARSFGVAFNGGNVLVPEELSHELITYAQEENPLRKYGTIHKTKGMQGFPVQVKKADANIVPTERDENNKIPSTDIEFDDVFLAPIEIDAIIKVTKKLTHMSDFDIEAIVMDELKKAYVRKEAYWHFNADQNPGSLTKKAVNFVVKTGTTNKYLMLVQLKNALPTAIRNKARWLINREAQTELESILDNNGNPILKESGNEDFPYTLFTFPVEVSDYADKWDATGKKYDPSVPMIYFGNLSFFHIQDVIATMEIEKLTEKYSDENKIGFKIYHITDGQLIYGPLEIPVYFLDINAETTEGAD